MSNYSEISLLLERLKPIVDNQIARHPAVKSAIKAKNGTIISVDTTNKTAEVAFPFDSTLITLPYNPKVEGYLTTGEPKGKQVSVWYYQTIQNGVIMQNKDWNLAGGDIPAIDTKYIQFKNEKTPAERFGGTWVIVKESEGRFLIGASENYILGTTGGSANAVVVKHGSHVRPAGGDLNYQDWEIPPNSGNSYFLRMESVSSFGNTRPFVLEYGNEMGFRTIYKGEDGTGKNMPPYIVANIWKRIA